MEKYSSHKILSLAWCGEDQGENWSRKVNRVVLFVMLTNGKQFSLEQITFIIFFLSKLQVKFNCNYDEKGLHIKLGSLKEGADILGWIQSNPARNCENKCHRADDWTTSRVPYLFQKEKKSIFQQLYSKIHGKEHHVKEQVNWGSLLWRRLRGDHIAVQSYLEGGYSEEGVSPFSQVSSEMIQGDELEFHQGRFRFLED